MASSTDILRIYKFSSLKVIFVLFVAKNMDNTLCCGYGSDAGCRFLDTGYLKVIIFFYPASSIQG
jgi:hypothetical protein